MKQILFITLITLGSMGVNAQDSIRYHHSKSNLYAELGGPGYFSGNYERLLPIYKLFSASARAGIGIYPADLGLFGGEPRFVPVLPISGSLLLGKTFSLEAGFAMSLGFNDESDTFGQQGAIKWYNGIVGFRYQKPNESLLLRLGYTPMFRYSAYCPGPRCIGTTSYMHFYGISIGARIRSKKPY